MSPDGPAPTAGNEQRKHAVRRWKFEKPHDGQVQSPGRGRFLLGGKGVRISAARSNTRLEDGETSIAFSLRARPFMHKLSAACRVVSEWALSQTSALASKEDRSTYLLVGREDSETGAGWLVLLRCTQSPESDRSSAKLGKPALELGLSGVVRQAGHMQNLTPLRQEGTDIGTSIHRPREHVWVLVRRLRLVDEPTENASQRYSFFYSPTRRSWRKSLQVEGEVVLDRGTGLYRLDLQSSTDIGKRRRSEGQRLRVVLLPSLIFGSQIERARMLEVRRQHNVFIATFSRKLDTEIPSLQCYEHKLEVLGEQMLVGKGVKSADSIVEGASVPDMFPGQGSQASYITEVGQQPSGPE